MEGVVHGGAHQNVEAKVGAHVALVAVVFYGMHAAKQHAAFGGHIAARFHEKAPGIAGFFGPRADEGVQTAAKFRHVQAGLPLVLVVGDAETAAEVDDFKRVQRALGQLFGQMQQHFCGIEVAFGLHKEGANVLVDARQGHVVLFQQGEDLVHLAGVDAKLRLLARGHDLGVVACADAGIKAHHNLAALVDGAEVVQLGERIHADKQVVAKGVLQLAARIVVGNIQDLFRLEASKLIHVQFAWAHGIHHQTFFAHHAQKHGVGVGLDGIVDAKARMVRKPHEVAAPLAQHVLVIHIERSAEGFCQFARCVAAVKVLIISITGANVGHRYLWGCLKNFCCCPRPGSRSPLGG